MKHPLARFTAAAVSMTAALLVGETVALAEPDFPNLDLFVAAPAKDYAAGPDVKYPMLSFTAPNGLHCAISSSRGSTRSVVLRRITGRGPGSDLCIGKMTINQVSGQAN